MESDRISVQFDPFKSFRERCGCDRVPGGVGMNFIESWFGFSPDRSSGSLEVTLAVVVLVVLAASLWFNKLGRRHSEMANSFHKLGILDG